MRISVVIPAYNEENYLADCLRALANQTVLPDEVIVVNNNSTDNTEAIARLHGAKVVFVEEQGITPARNAGFNAASGDIIARCDADTRPFPDWIARIKASFTDNAVLGITGTNEFYDAPSLFKPLIDKFFTVCYFAGNRLMLNHEAFYGSNMAIRTSAWQAVRAHVCNDDLLVHEDIDLAIHMAKHGKIIYDPELMVYCSFRMSKVNLATLVERMAKWPRSKLVHTKFRSYTSRGKQHSSSAQNLRPKYRQQLNATGYSGIAATAVQPISIE